MPGEVQLNVQTHNTVFPVTGGQQLIYVLIEALPTEVVANVMMPLNFGLVLDHSGSMSGPKIENLKKAAKLAVDQMGPQDMLSVVVFDDKVQVVTSCQPVSDPAGVKKQIDGIRAAGGTKMAVGLRKGLDELQRALGDNRISRLLLLTDGETYGDAVRCRQLAVEAGQKRIPITALGLGEDWNEELLEDIGSASGGYHDFIDQPDKIVSAFTRQVRSAQATVVQNAVMILRLLPGILPRAVWRVTPMISKLDHRALSDRDVQVDLGDMDRQQGQSVLVELLVPPRQAGTYRLSQAEVMYDVMALGLAGERVRADVIVGFTTDPAQIQENSEVCNFVEKVTTHKLQTRALDEAAVGNIVGATQKLRAAATRLLAMGEGDLAQTAQEEADRLERGQGLSPKGTKKLRAETRKLTQKLDDI
jgi:Ca-activated chloride channel homolog